MNPLVLLPLFVGASCMFQVAQTIEIDSLVERLNSKDDAVAFDAVKGLRKIGGPAVPGLIKALGRPEEQVRENTALCLWGIGQLPGNPDTQIAVPHLIKLIEKDPSARVRMQATSALARIGPSKAAVPALIQAVDKDSLSDAAKALAMIGPDAKAAVPALIVAAKKKGVNREAEFDDKWELRFHAVEALASIGHDAKELVPLFSERLSDVAWPVRFAAYEGLIKIGPEAKSAVPTIMTHLKGKRDIGVGGLDLRVLGAYALAVIDPENPVGLSSILELGKDKDQSATREVACHVLEKLGNNSEPVMAFLNEASSDKELTVRGAARDALATLKKTNKKK